MPTEVMVGLGVPKPKPYIRSRTLSIAATSIACVACGKFDDLGLAQTSVEQDSAVCSHAAVKPMSTSPTVAAGDNEFTVAIHHMAYPPADGGLPYVGFDLDKTCTGHGEGQSCRLPSWAVRGTDNPGGRDNSVTTVFFPDAGELAQEATQVVKGIERGLITTVIRVRHYNGLPNDGSVLVELLGATRSPSLLAQTPNNANWDGNDVWKPLVGWTMGPQAADSGTSWTSRYASSSAYVSDSVLVAHFDSALAATNFRFSNVWIQAHLVDGTGSGGPWSLRDGTYAGRVRIDDLLANTEYTPDPETNLPYTCMDSPSYLQTKKDTCRAVDISFSSDDPDAVCDAATWAWAFDAEPAKLGDEVDFTRPGDFHLCPPETSPVNDHCASLDGAAN